MVRKEEKEMRDQVQMRERLIKIKINQGEIIKIMTKSRVKEEQKEDQRVVEAREVEEVKQKDRAIMIVKEFQKMRDSHSKLEIQICQKHIMKEKKTMNQ